MKNLSDYLNEKKQDTTKAHKGKEGEGADDKKFIALMVEYKTLRKKKGEKESAAKILKKARDLSKDGDVSKKAKVAAAYL